MKKLLIGVMTSNLDMENASEVVQGIISQAQKCRCDIAVLSPLNNLQTIWNDHRRTSLDIYQLIVSPRFDGFILDRRYMDNADVEQLCENLLLQSNKPVMMIDGGTHRYFENTASDDRKPFEELTTHLIRVHGYRKIYCLTGPEHNPDAQERLKGYQDAMKEHGLYFDRTYWQHGDFWKRSARKMADEIADGILAKPEAILCGNDITAGELIMRLVGRGIRVPEDIAVVGFDCGDPNGECNISITSYKRANFQLGAESLRRLYRLLTGVNPPRVHNKIEGLRINASCGCPAYRHVHKKEERMARIQRDFAGRIYTREIAYEAGLAKDLQGALEVISRYTIFLYHYSRFSIHLTEATMQAMQTGETDGLTFDIHSRMCHCAEYHSNFRNSYPAADFAMEDILPAFAEPQKRSSAYFLSPLHYGDRFFGYTALSYGKYAFTYDISYQMFVKYIDDIVFRLIGRAAFAKKTESAQRTNSGRMRLYSGIIAGAERKISEMLFISCEITDMKLLYGKYGGKKVVAMIRRIVSEFSEKLREDEMYGFLSENRFCIVTPFPDRMEEIFRELKNSVICLDEPISITLGTHRFQPETIGEEDDIYDLLGEAVNHTIYTYNHHHHSGSRQLYEKLYDLRKELEHAPEQKWTIDTMCSRLHISRSTLQKNYKAFFGKSIIDELISFRIAKAKRLLEDTSDTLSKIAELCGYSSDTYLIKQFKKMEGITPNEYRERVSGGVSCEDCI